MSTRQERRRRQRRQERLGERRRTRPTLPPEVMRPESRGPSTGAGHDFIDDRVYGIRMIAREGRGYRAEVRWHVDHDSYVALAALTELRRYLDVLEVELVAQVRADEASWDDVGWALGITGEGARKRFGSKP